MNILLRPASSPAELSGLVPAGGLVLAATSESRAPRYARARAVAAELAHAAGARVMLVDVSASNPPGAAHASPDGVRRPLHAWELEALGRAYLLHQIGETAARSIHATAWLADRSEPAAIADAAGRTGASLVVLAADPDPAPDPMGRPVLRLTAAYHASRIGVPVVTVDDAGIVRVVEPLAVRHRAPEPERADRPDPASARRVGSRVTPVADPSAIAAPSVAARSRRAAEPAAAETRTGRARRRLRAACEAPRVLRSGTLKAAAGT